MGGTSRSHAPGRSRVCFTAVRVAQHFTSLHSCPHHLDLYSTILPWAQTTELLKRSSSRAGQGSLDQRLCEPWQTSTLVAPSPLLTAAPRAPNMPCRRRFHSCRSISLLLRRSTRHLKSFNLMWSSTQQGLSQPWPTGSAEGWSEKCGRPMSWEHKICSMQLPNLAPRRSSTLVPAVLSPMT